MEKGEKNEQNTTLILSDVVTVEMCLKDVNAHRTNTSQNSSNSKSRTSFKPQQQQPKNKWFWQLIDWWGERDGEKIFMEEYKMYLVWFDG